jgi:uncharacterized protein (TIGR02145 family)
MLRIQLKISVMLFISLGLTRVQAQTDTSIGTVTDIDGNVYHTVTIGTQTWMVENLKTTRYRNGDSIATTYPDTLDISNENFPKYQWAYSSDESNAASFGRLYTWYAVIDSRSICPVGWHVPIKAEWDTLTHFLGGEKAAHGKLKEVGTTHWKSPNTDATNASGFTGLPGGGHAAWAGIFSNIGKYGHFWSATEYNTKLAWRWLLSYDGPPKNYKGYCPKEFGWSVRCIKD